MLSVGVRTRVVRPAAAEMLSVGVRTRVVRPAAGELLSVGVRARVVRTRVAIAVEMLTVIKRNEF